MLEPATIVKNFQKIPEPRKISQGENIFIEGENGNLMYGIIEGQVEFLVEDKIVETLTKGDIFGIGALVHKDQIRASTARAKTDCIVAEIDQERFMFLVQQTPMFALLALQSYSDRLRHLKHTV